MSLARRAARAALAASFISGGIDQIRNPRPKIGPSYPVAKPIADRVPQLPNDPESLVKLDGALKILGGVGLVLGPLARPAALLLAANLVPTTLGGHRFWETTDPQQRDSDRVEFFKNVSLTGGLLLAALDTGGRPSVPWVAGRAVHGAAESVGEAAETVGGAVTGAMGAVTGAVGAATGAAGALSGAVAQRAGRVRGRSARRAGKAAKAAEKARGRAARAAEKAKGRAAKATEEAKGRAARAAEEARGRAARAAEEAKGRAARTALVAGGAARGVAAARKGSGRSTRQRVLAVVSR
jgi:uncharacterized membrane protein YphA (DoxX/SURF4 family)